MTHDERWQTQYKQLLEFIQSNQRRPSKYHPEDAKLFNWFKHNRKLFAHGKLRGLRKEQFEVLMNLAAKYRHINQFDIPKIEKSESDKTPTI